MCGHMSEDCECDSRILNDIQIKKEHLFGHSEVALLLENGNYLVAQSFDQNHNGTQYVRICDSQGKELYYWDAQEWADEPQNVMGAIIGACLVAGSFNDPCR